MLFVELHTNKHIKQLINLYDFILGLFIDYIGGKSSLRDFSCLTIINTSLAIHKFYNIMDKRNLSFL